jgi:hypothetical protein
MHLDVLRCKLPAMVHKEIAAHLLAYNLVRSVMGGGVTGRLLPCQLGLALQLLTALRGIFAIAPRARLVIR